MPRTARIWQRAVCYHLFNRGVGPNPIFRNETDLAHFVGLIQDYKEISGAKIYHWAVMPSHYHMLVEIVFDNLRPFAGGIQQCYAHYHHARHGSHGVFWSGRYRSKPVEIGDYLVRCGRYIERNPTRAGLVEQPWEYRWSSAAYYVLGNNDGVTSPDMYAFTDRPDAEQRATYGKALMSTSDDEWMKREQKGRVIGSEAFAARVQSAGRRHRRKRGRPAKSVSVSM